MWVLVSTGIISKLINKLGLFIPNRKTLQLFYFAKCKVAWMGGCPFSEKVLMELPKDAAPTKPN